MAHELPSLGYAYDALAPHFDARTKAVSYTHLTQPTTPYV